MSTTQTLAAWRAAAQTLVTEHGPVAYWTAGQESAPPLLLIHGFPTASWDWAKVWDRLAATFRLIALDMFGFGLSAKPANFHYAIDAQAGLQERLCARLGIERVHVLAHDYGVTVTQELMARALDGDGALALDSVVFLNGGLIPAQHRARPIQRALAGPFGFLVTRLFSKRGFAASFSEIFAPEHRPSAEEIDDFWSLIRENDGNLRMHRLIGYIAERRANAERWTGAIAQTPTPQTLVCGALDPVSGAHVIEPYRALVPHADPTLLETLGHYPQWEGPEETLAAFNAFHARLGT